MKRILSASLVAAGLAAAPPVHAAELKVLAGGSMTASLKELAPRFERATGHKLNIEFASTPVLIKLATSGPFDVGVVPQDVMQDAAARAAFAAGPTIDIARVGYGVVVRAGGAKPDVSTPAALKETLLKAQSIALLPESAAGAYVLKTFDRLGIADAIKAKIKPQPTPAQIPQAVANGDAELGVFLMNVLVARGVELAGPFPAELQQDVVFTGAVAASSKEVDAARAFIDYLRTPEASAVIKAKGIAPG